jgi:hypothetical protein
MAWEKTEPEPEKDQVITIDYLKSKLERKQKRREKKILQLKAKFDKPKEKKSKRVKFGLENNKVKEFYLNGRLTTSEDLASKTRSSPSEGIIKKK